MWRKIRFVDSTVVDVSAQLGDIAPITTVATWFLSEPVERNTVRLVELERTIADLAEGQPRSIVQSEHDLRDPFRHILQTDVKSRSD